MAFNFGGLGNLFTSGLTGLGNMFSSGVQSVGQGIGSLFGNNNAYASSAANPYSGSSWNWGNVTKPWGGASGSWIPQTTPISTSSYNTANPFGSNYNALTGLQGAAGNYTPQMGSSSGGGASGGGGGQGGLGGLWNKMGGFSNKNPLLTGLVGMFGSQLVGNPKAPRLPQSFLDYQRMAQGGGPGISQTGATAASGILNTPFSQVSSDEEAAATHALDLNYQEQLRQLTGMYKSLRPGTDPTTDTTYRRDLGLLNDQYARERAEVLAHLHRSAYADYANRQLQGAGIAGQLGSENMAQQAAAIQTEVSRQAQQWMMDYQKQQALRNSLMGLGSNVGQLGVMQQLFPNGLFPSGQGLVRGVDY